MPENDYTGAEEEASIFADFLEDGFFEEMIDEDAEVTDLEDDDEIALNFADIVNGESSLLAIATRLYDLADELTDLSENGWEIVDDVTNGQATAVQFGDEDSTE